MIYGGNPFMDRPLGPTRKETMSFAQMLRKLLLQLQEKKKAKKATQFDGELTVDIAELRKAVNK
jgi:hypothetical protein